MVGYSPRQRAKATSRSFMSMGRHTFAHNQPLVFMGQPERTSATMHNFIFGQSNATTAEYLSKETWMLAIHRRALHANKYNCIKSETIVWSTIYFVHIGIINHTYSRWALATLASCHINSFSVFLHSCWCIFSS